MYILGRTDILKLFGPDGDADFPEMGGAQQVHIGPGLTNAATNGQGDQIVEQGLVIRQF